MSTLLVLNIFLAIAALVSTYDLVIVSRDEWGARDPKQVEVMANPVPYVVIHHSYIPPACNTTPDCIEAMRWMQIFHQDDRGWNDIGYSFGVGGDGNAYVGRGWSAIGAHAPGMNNQSIGICVIGDWTSELPPQKQLATVRNLITYGIEQGHIQPDYVLIGHRQVRDTECPGNALFQEITTWDHFRPNNPLEQKVESRHHAHKHNHHAQAASDESSNTVPTR